MVNRLKGLYQFTVGGVDYTVRLTTNELIDAKGMGVDINKPNLLSDLGLEEVRTLLFVGLRRAHPEFDLPLVGDLITEMGLSRAGEVVGEAISAAFPDAKPANPPKPSPTANGTGNGS